MSYREDEKRWKRLQEILIAEASGKPVRPAVSQRTLFGIPSTVERTIERIVNEEEERLMNKLKQAESAPHAHTHSIHACDASTHVLDVASVVALEHDIAQAGTSLAELMERAGCAVAAAAVSVETGNATVPMSAKVSAAIIRCCLTFTHVFIVFVM